jgi:uncharacterized membrane protein
MQEEEQTTTTRTTADQPTATRQTTTRTAVSGAVVARRVVYWIGGFIIALLALRFIFLLLGANRGSGFVNFIYDLTSVLVAPFTGIFGEPTFGVSYFETSALVAIIIYALITIGIGKLLTLNRSVN